jgi:hypothetical protein
MQRNSLSVLLELQHELQTINITNRKTGLPQNISPKRNPSLGVPTKNSCPQSAIPIKRKANKTPRKRLSSIRSTLNNTLFIDRIGHV